MRFVIVLFALFLLPLLVWAHYEMFRAKMQPRLAKQAKQALIDAGIKRSEVLMDFLDVKIFGLAEDAEARKAAAKSVAAIKGIRFAESENHLVVPARVDFEIIDGVRLNLSGWLPDEKAVRELVKVVSAYRPDLRIDDKKLRIAPFVMARDKESGELTAGHRLVKPILDAIRVPPSFAVEKTKDGYKLKGWLPSEQLRQEIIDAAQSNPGGWTIAFAELRATNYVEEADFTRTSALAAFVRSYFQSPSPGVFSIDAAGIPSLAADATIEMEAEWLALLRPVSGAAKVEARLNRFPSICHLPGYRIESRVIEGTLEPLKAALKQGRIFFDTASAEIKPEEDVKLPPVAAAILACGPGLRLVIGGFTEPGGDPSPMIQLRAENVRQKLMELGVAEPQMEIAHFGPLPLESSDLDEQKRLARRIEILIK